MRTIVAGSRTISDIATVARAMDSCGWKITTVISGTAAGVDSVGEMVAAMRGILVERFPPDYSLGRAAPMIRNGQMADSAEALVLIWDGESRGSANMLGQAQARGLRIFTQVI